ncbi:hypothetical protein B0H67DRAFT_562550 [Lasiosphaeris hirsuta]|uniref:Pentatricopeptide repeat-containing protein n=1 Tax=Lasiosphaeris hirsuta TaxID=260670 RepID=A0AA40EB19_9PEZI|nr:hypothetical protein B0H67DRAFT_562550 [Lasiosphaeris hirsuta]
MPPRALALDRTKTSYVCQSCISNLQALHPNPQPWLTRHASNLARRPPPRLQPAVRNTRGAQDPLSNKKLQQTLAQLQGGRPNPEASSRPEEKPNQDITINYFNQDINGRRHQLRNDEEFSAISGGLDTDVESAISRLEAQMVNTVEMLKRMEKGGMRDKAEKLRGRFKRSLRLQYKGKIGPEDEEYGLLRIPGFSGPKQRTIASLNKFLSRESVVKDGIPTHKDLVECWKFYSAARKTLSSAWGNMPREVWDFLWMILSWEGVENPNRMRHIYVLTKDMSAAGLVLRRSQQLLAIEAMFIEGWQKEAIESWKKAVVTLGSNPDTFRSYWELGVRMCSLHGDTDRAQKAADTILKSVGQSDPRILIPIIRASSVKEATLEQAWETYRNMRDLLGEAMTIEDYDEVIGSFLGGNCVEHALQAFVDMMFSGAINVRGKTRLPIAVSNQFFVGKWLKRLIGAGDLDGAYKVVVYLQEKGIAASPIQLNGLIGAWIRADSAEGLEKAEDLAWDMIRSRLAHVDMRQRAGLMERPATLFDPLGLTARDKSNEGKPEFRCATKATAETFSLLAENYCSRGLHDRLQKLWKAFRHSEIGTTSFLLNQVLRSYTQNGQPGEAVALYQSMTQDHNVRPDAHTFIALFNTLSVNRLIQREVESSERDIIEGRHYFKDMVKSKWVFDSPEDFIYLPRTILFTMLKARDYSGMIIAARTMKVLFGFAPPESLLIELAAGTATLRVRTKQNVTRVMEGSRVIEGLIRQAREELFREGYDVNNLTVEQKAAELHEVLEKLILIKAKAQHLRPEVMRPALVEAAEHMGVHDIVFGGDVRQISEHRKVVRPPMVPEE